VTADETTAEEHAMYRHILVPVAFEATHPPEPALEAAARLLGPQGRVTVLHVMEEPEPLAGMFFEPGYMDTLRAGLAEELQTLAGRFANGQGVLLVGHAGRDIAGWAAGNDVDCIVMASHGRKGAARYFLGSTADHVVRHARCSVLVLRDHG